MEIFDFILLLKSLKSKKYTVYSQNTALLLDILYAILISHKGFFYRKSRRSKFDETNDSV